MAATPNPGKFMWEQLVRQVRPALKAIVRSRFDAAKEWLMETVENHPVSVDLRSHGPSQFLKTGHNETMFGFLGMEKGRDPVSDLLVFLDQSITYTEGGTSARGLYSARVVIPSKADMSKAPSLSPPWIDVSWPVLVEDGFSGLANYLNEPWSKSVSGEGFQANNTIREADFGGEDFLTPIFGQFRTKLLLK